MLSDTPDTTDRQGAASGLLLAALVLAACGSAP